ncbi:DUF4214 domain-containing protein [Ectothiorhodospira variabilis]|uniref:DUF4214 domain-containing protein n=1 Tax=Ectothiorhodospira variabilis TaxID=505694 RepID=UPI001EFB757C|nr:DUF4214 domain-containing protein [Ectothiorhodospira variabilis]MCG5495836.1 DUF4214 domain-containing protein [Ectothiorhodospira variabilis]MCG5504537.1 DUF4214 domain-containing protein [Ectothiorhodospira variabilis]MCG5507756.1 DUF4214 domain-containing protein [Ectothiorhodospira variabilis]
MGTRKANAIALASSLFMYLFSSAVSASNLPERENLWWQVTEIYVATLGRAPDAEGIQYWVQMIHQEPAWTPETVAQSFFDQPLVKQAYPSQQSAADFVKAVYDNVFGRPPEQPALEYWEQELASQLITRDKLIIALINAGWQNPNAADDMRIFGNKVRGAATFADVQTKLGISYTSLSLMQQEHFHQIGRELIQNIHSGNIQDYASFSRDRLSTLTANPHDLTATVLNDFLVYELGDLREGLLNDDHPASLEREHFISTTSNLLNDIIWSTATPINDFSQTIIRLLQATRFLPSIRLECVEFPHNPELHLPIMLLQTAWWGGRDWGEIKLHVVYRDQDAQDHLLEYTSGGRTFNFIESNKLYAVFPETIELSNVESDDSNSSLRYGVEYDGSIGFEMELQGIRKLVNLGNSRCGYRPEDDHGNTIADATPVPLNSTIVGAIDYPNDIDVFKIEVDAPGELTLRTRARDPWGATQTRGTLMDEDGMILKRTGNWARHFNLQYPVSTGVYYLAVQDLYPGQKSKYYLDVGVAYDHIVDGRFLPMGDRVRDVRTGLLWHRCLLGQSWDGSQCLGNPQLLLAREALDTRHDRYRLPTVEELNTLVYCSSGQPQQYGADVCEGNYLTPTLNWLAFPTFGENFPIVWGRSPTLNAAGQRTLGIVDFRSGRDHDIVGEGDIDFAHSAAVRLVADP